MTVFTALDGAVRRSPRAPGAGARTSHLDREPRTLGIQGLLRIAEISTRATDRHAFAVAVLDSARRGLQAEAALLVVRDAEGAPDSRHAGAATVVRRLVTHVRALAGRRRGRAATWTGEEHGLAVLGAVVPDEGHGEVLLCVGRDPGAGFLRRERELVLGYAQTTALVLERMRLQARIDRQRGDVTAAFVSALASRDGYLQGHSTRVALYADALARTMGLPAEDVAVTRRTGILHDLGKLSTPDRILLKPARLTDDEYGLVKHHPVVASSLLEPYAFLAAEAAAVKRHHERYDGDGYPDGLRGREIPLAARLVAVADAFDAMTSDRPYRAALPFEFARQEIREGAGRQFDPEAAAAWETIPDARLAELRRQGGGREMLHRLLR